MIGRGTTPTHRIRLKNFDSSLIKRLMIIYAQGDVEVFHKNEEACTLDGENITITLTQEETLKLNHTCNVQIQVRGLTHDGVAFRSKIVTTAVGKILNEEILV